LSNILHQNCVNTKAKLTDSQTRYKEERRQLLMDAAAKVIAKQGIRSTTMEDISASMGMTKIVLYRTFGTKDELIHAILEHVTNVPSTTGNTGDSASNWLNEPGSGLNKERKQGRAIVHLKLVSSVKPSCHSS